MVKGWPSVFAAGLSADDWASSPKGAAAAPEKNEDDGAAIVLGVLVGTGLPRLHSVGKYDGDTLLGMGFLPTLQWRILRKPS